MDRYPPDPETYAIIGAAMEVHRHWGSGFLEAVYHKSLAIHLRRLGFDVAREVPFPLSYLGEDLGTVYRADMVCNGTILLELKAHSGLCTADLAQTVHYLRASGLSRALLFNFGLPKLQRRRIVLGDQGFPSVSSVESVFPPTADEGTGTDSDAVS